jgi:histidinol phosphatase-like PHP family hydrolase
MTITTTYKSGGLWLKGNLHTHTKNSPCGNYPVEEVAAAYGNSIMQYDFLSITDHMLLTDVSAIQGQGGLILYPGVEYKPSDVYQTLGINIRSYNDDIHDENNHQEIFDEVASQGGINIICHPHIYRDDYWPLKKLLRLNGYTAIEIYNHNVKMNNAGRAVAVDLWDAVLTEGKKVFGIASDDFHDHSRCGGGFIMVNTAKKTAPAILKAIEAGAFYASAGIFLKDIQVIENRRISLAAAAKKVPGTLFRFIGKGGRLLAEVRAETPDGEVSYDPHGDEAYVRVEAVREDGAMAWTQPFWIE